jgi:peptidoglycan/LPS O-acetylase OafA/YrhL
MDPLASVVAPVPRTGLAYRPDVDGLRAVAVLAVLGFHASPRLVPGGFVGVDVFFVVSGYLISGLLFREFSERDRFDAADFYARRIRRIFPALMVMLAGCLAIGWLVLVQSEFAQLESHTAAASAFFSNFALWRESGYFDRSSEVKPLLHLWSLGIEEQFYLFWPPLAYWCWKRRINMLSLIVVIIAASLLLNIVLVGKYAVATFYLPHSRIWELLTGALLAFVHQFRSERVDAAVHRLVFASPRHADPRVVANLKAGAGISLLAVAIFGFAKSIEYPGLWRGIVPLHAFASGLGLDAGMVYPGWWAAVPVLGTMLMIAAGPLAFVNRRILSARPLVYLGLMSYPLYLWHWPLLAFVRITESGHPSRGLRAAAIALSFVLAWLTFVVVERPIRRRVSRATPWRVVALASILCAIGGAAAIAAGAGRPTSRTPVFATAIDDIFASPRFDANCNRLFPTTGEYCQQYAESPKVTTALIGDSHAEAFLHGIGARLTARGENVVHLGESGCPPLLDIERISPGTTDTCGANRSVLEFVANNPDLARVVMAFRGTTDITGTGFAPVERDMRITVRIAGTSLPAGESIRIGLARTVEYLAARGKVVWLLLQVPELDFQVDECAGRPFSFEHTVRTPCGVAASIVRARQAPYRAVVEDVRQHVPALHVFDPLPYLCDQEFCFAMRNGELLYRDSDHLSRAGSLFFADKLPF